MMGETAGKYKSLKDSLSMNHSAWFYRKEILEAYILKACS